MNNKNLKDFQYFVINTPDAWRQGFCESLFIDQQGALSLTPTFDITDSDRIGYATGIIHDANGHLYLIDAQKCAIYQYSIKEDSLKMLECLDRCMIDKCAETVDNCYTHPVQEPRSLFECGIESGQFNFRSDDSEFGGGLAISNSTLYVADTFNHRIQAFYLPTFQLRFVLGVTNNYLPIKGSEAGAFDEPRDIVLDSHENFFVLDYGNERIQKFTRYGRYLLTFGKGTNSPLELPSALAIDREDFLYVLDSSRHSVEKFDKAGEWLETVLNLESSMQIKPAGLAVDLQKNIYIGQADEQADSKIYQFDSNGRYLGNFGGYEGICHKLQVDAAGQLFGTCGGRLLIFSGDKKFQKSGAYYSRIFDSTIPSCKWHRLALDMQSASNAHVVVQFRAAEARQDLEELDSDEWTKLLEAPQNSMNVDDALFPDMPGRYLRLRFNFSGEGSQTYKIKRAQIYFQRLSYLRYLPAVYQEEEHGREFLERFLSIFETMFYDLESKIDSITEYFDPQAVDSEFLQWLGTWFAVLNDDNWPEERRRAFLENAFQLYKIRGTIEGLKKTVEIFTKAKVTIIEHFKFKSPMVLGTKLILGQSTMVGANYTKRLVLEESSTIGDFLLTETESSPEQPFRSHAFDFTILADTSMLENDDQFAALNRLVEQEKPAHTRCFLCTGQNAEMQIGLHAILGVDTRLSSGYTPMRLGETSIVGQKSIVGSKYRRRGEIGKRSKIEINTILL